MSMPAMVPADRARVDTAAARDQRRTCPSPSALATRWARERAPTLPIALRTWVRTVSWAIWSSSAISGPLLPRATWRTTSSSRSDSAPAAGPTVPSRRNRAPQREVLRATKRTRWRPVTTSAVAPHWTPTRSPSLRTRSASPLNRCSASSPRHSAGVASGPSATNSHIRCPPMSSRRLASSLSIAPLASTIRRCSSTSTIALRDSRNAPANSFAHPSWRVTVALIGWPHLPPPRPPPPPPRPPPPHPPLGVGRGRLAVVRGGDEEARQAEGHRQPVGEQAVGEGGHDGVVGAHARQGQHRRQPRLDEPQPARG